MAYFFYTLVSQSYRDGSETNHEITNFTDLFADKGKPSGGVPQES